MIPLFVLAAALSEALQPVPLNQEVWISGQDYPPQALLLGQEGKVAVSIQVDKSGKPLACKVEKTSGHTELDNKTCDLIVARARFNTATEGAIRLFRVSLNWRIPKSSSSTAQCDTILQIFPMIDANKDNNISETEWMNFWDSVPKNGLSKNPSLKEATATAFLKADPNKDGLISLQEMEADVAKRCSSR